VVSYTFDARAEVSKRSLRDRKHVCGRGVPPLVAGVAAGGINNNRRVGVTAVHIVSRVEYSVII